MPNESNSLARAFIDALAARQLWVWLLHYPRRPLSTDLLLTLLTTRSVAVSLETFWARDIEERSKWHAEFRELTRSGKLEVVSTGETNWPKQGKGASSYWLSRRGLQGHRDGPLLDDFFTLAHCERTETPFLHSRASVEHLEELSVLFDGYQRQAVWGHANRDIVQRQSARPGNVFGVVVSAEAPELELRKRHQALENAIEAMDGLQDITPLRRRPEIERDAFLAQWWGADYTHELYLSPPELLELLADVDAADSLSRAIAECMKLPSDPAEINAHVKEQWDKHAGRVKIAGILFDAISVLALPLPWFASAAQLAAQRLAGLWLPKNVAWLVTLRGLNARLRTDRRTGALKRMATE